MYKKYILSSMATAAIMLFNIQFNVHAESLKVSGEKKEVNDATYETLQSLEEGQITGTDLKVTGNKNTNSSSNENNYVISTEGKGSAIKLTGDKTTIKGTDSDIPLGVEAKNDAILQMTGGTITVSGTGVHFENSNSIENKLENVTISSGKDDAPLDYGINAEKNSTVALTNVKVSQTTNAIVADDHSTITVSGGSFDAKGATIVSQGNSIISLTNDTQITSSKNDGLLAKDGGAISMTGGTIKASIAGAAFENSEREENKLENVTISNVKGDALLHYGIDTEKNSTVALTNVTVSQATNAIVANDNSQITVSGGSFDAKKATIYAQKGSSITLTDEARITSSEDVGLVAKDDGAISMTGGTIKASYSGATFKNSNSAENKLENVTISSVKDDALLHYGIDAEKNSTVTLTNVTVSQATNAIVANDNSQITVSGGSFDAKEATIYAQKGSTITLTDEARITSSEDDGLYAKDGGAISMTGGNIKSSKAGAAFKNSNSAENKLKNVTISSVKDGALLVAGISAEQNSKVDLENVKVTQAKSAVFASNNSTITVTGGSFDAKEATIYAQKGSTITLTDEARITSSDGNGLYANGLGSTITMTKGNVTGRYTTLVTEDGGHITATDITIATTKGSGLGVNAINSNSTIELYGTTINNASIGLYAQNGGTIKMTGGTITTSTSGASFNNSKSDENKLKDVTISNNKKGNSLIFVGLNSQSSHVSLENVHITDAYIGAFAMDHSEVTISGGSFAGSNAAISAESGSTITLTDNVQITSSNGNGLHANGSDSTITMTGGTVTGKEAVLFAENGGHINVTNISATAENSGIKFKNPEENITSEINLTNAKLHIKDGIGINVDESTATVNLSKKSEIGADVLLVTKASTKEDNFAFTLNANDSILEGRASIAQERNVRFDLKNNTQWILKTSTQEKDDDGNLLDIAQRSRSDISVLNLENSSLVFKEPTADGYYHTLHIGSGKPDTKVVYNATGDAKIYFNTKWTNGTPIEEQKTDHLLIHGDVSGSTTVYIQSDSGDKNSVINASDPSNSGGLSLIQVSGKAEEDSFKLTNGYTTRGGSPYKYTLTGYGPESSHGIANVEQSLFDEKNENFWDFRLHKEFLDSHSTVEEPVAQMASYLVMPNALFYTGLTDMAKQNALLDNMRTSVVAKEQEKQSGFFLYTYGGTGTLSSARGPLQYGYGAHLRYAALQGGVNFAALEGQNTTTHFGLVGTYGQLSFTPKDMKDAGKSTLDKWSITAYGSIQHDNGFYLDALLSYGILKGDITNAIIGKTATLKNAKMLGISTTIGKQFATGIQGVTFEPQAQLAYQHLLFDTLSDADNFTIDMKNPHQWMIRVGGRLTKTVATAENGHSVSFYGKVNAIKTFGDDQAIHIDKDYKIDPMGTLLEGGLGVSAQLSSNVSLHGDVSYQQKLQKTGISGA
ncbi:MULTISPECIES: autotransporter outer membrane beta-barrel domain-containing protein, partial [unclassified Bartonella]|uniref:autotransporter outer membrane beta-barrel domain-containing protein n=1 Tax=unclassified Bartonella TaxID=2645622 RepID=UPI00235FADB8